MQRQALRLALASLALAATGAGADQVPIPQDNMLARPAQADMRGTQGSIRPTFDALDADRNGSLASSEVVADAALAARFAELDVDGDATLSRAEHDDYLAVAASTDNDGE